MFAVGRTVQSEMEGLPRALGARHASGDSAHVARLRPGQVDVHVGLFERDASHVLRPRPDFVHLVIPTAGRVDIIGAVEVGRLDVGHVLLVGQNDAVAFSWRADAAVMILDVPRIAIQAHVFATYGEPRRLGRTNLLLSCADPQTPLGRAIQALSGLQAVSVCGESQLQGWVSSMIVDALSEALRAPEAAGLFPLAASVRRALDRLAEEAAAPATIEDLARAAGVVPATLRRSVKAATGLALARLIENARFEWARARLSSNLESRPLAALAAAAGYAPVAFTRAYRRRFGETPTQTRARAVSTAR